MRIQSLAIVTVLGLALGACAGVHNLPLNRPSANPFAGTMVQMAAAAERHKIQASDEEGGAVIGLALSGGGTRAAGFAFGALQELGRTPSPDRGGKQDLLDHVRIVSGVSGGSIIAAYFGLKGRAALADFREQFLTQDLMSQLNTRVSLVNLGRAVGGGANTDNALRDWLNRQLFRNATYAALIGRRPIVLINATDIYSRTPFLFAPPTFAAMCSDIAEYPVAGAVAASAAVPGAFAPVIVEPFPRECKTPLPERVMAAVNNPDASPLLHSFAKGLERARMGQVKYVKLLDGGLVDNYGLSGITIARASAGTAYSPLRPEEAVKLRRLLFVVVDAGRGPQGDWSQTLEGPSGSDLVGAVIDTIIDANTRSSYAAFEAAMRDWRDDVIKWRCGLRREEVARLRGRSGPWNCRDLKFTLTRISFDQFDAARSRKLNSVPTSFTLPAETIDEVVRAGGDALRANKTFQAFLKDR